MKGGVFPALYNTIRSITSFVYKLFILLKNSCHRGRLRLRHSNI